VVNFAGHRRLVGSFVDVAIGEARSHSLRGTVVAAAPGRTGAARPSLPQ